MDAVGHNVTEEITELIILSMYNGDLNVSNAE